MLGGRTDEDLPVLGEKHRRRDPGPAIRLDVDDRNVPVLRDRADGVAGAEVDTELPITHTGILSGGSGRR